MINYNFYSKISQEQKYISCGNLEWEKLTFFLLSEATWNTSHNYQPGTSLLNDFFLIFSLVLKPDNLQGVSRDQFKKKKILILLNEYRKKSGGILDYPVFRQIKLL